MTRTEKNGKHARAVGAQHENPPGLSFGSSELGNLIRSFDWSATTLGPIKQWPHILKDSVNIILHSPVPIVMLWGQDGFMIYNDAYAVFAGSRHPALLGSKVLEGWTEVADFNRNVLDVGLAGGTLSYRDQHLLLYRAGVPEDTWMDLNYSPILDEQGTPVAVMAIVVETTDRVLEEQRRKQAEERFQLALNASAIIGTWLWEPHTNRFTADERFARAFSIDAAQAVEGVPLEDVIPSIHPDDLPHVIELITEAVRRGGPYRAEYRIRLPNGSFRWIEANGHCELAPDGTAVRFPGVLLDIHARKQNEARQAFLLETGDRLRELADPNEILRASAEALGRHLGVERAGYAEVSATGELATFTASWTSGALPALSGTVDLDAFSHQGSSELCDCQHVVYESGDGAPEPGPADPDGQIRSALLIPFVKDAQLKALLYLHSAEPRSWSQADISLAQELAERTWDSVARARAEAGLRELNATLAEHVEHRTRERDRIWSLSQDPFVISDGEGRWLSVNPAWTQILGWAEQDFIGRTSEWMEHPDDLQQTRSEIGRLANGFKTIRFENRFRHKDGSYRWFSWTAVPDNGLLYCVARDVTAEKERQAELEQMQALLRQSQKMEAVGQLTGGIAHDFNNLLTGIISGLDLLQRRIAAGRLDDVDRYVNTATASAKRAAALTHRLLAFSRQQSLDVKPSDVNDLIVSLEDLIRRTMGESIAFTTRLDPELWATLTDANQLESALLNLCINARDAMPGGGKLMIATENLTLGSSDTRSMAELEPGDYVGISVSDTGSGMAPDVIERAFDPFFTTKPIGQGTGLGLSMIYGFVKQLGGHIRIQSALGQGTTVRLFLPRHDVTATVLHQGELGERPRAEDGECVLVVEDDSAVRMVVVEVLDDLGYKALEAGDAQAAIPQIESGERIDLLVTDVGLPGMNGRQLAEIARQKRPDLPVLFVTGYAEGAAIRDKFLDAGMEMIAKPFDIDVLAATIRAMIGHE